MYTPDAIPFSARPRAKPRTFSPREHVTASHISRLRPAVSLSCQQLAVRITHGIQNLPLRRLSKETRSSLKPTPSQADAVKFCKYLSRVTYFRIEPTAMRHDDACRKPEERSTNSPASWVVCISGEFQTAPSETHTGRRSPWPTSSAPPPGSNLSWSLLLS